MNPLFFMVIVMAGLMFVTLRSNKKRQAQAQDMRSRLEPGAGVRTIGGMYALVKDVTNEAVELEVAPGVYALYAKQAIAQVMDPVEYNRIVHGEEPEADETAEATEDTDAVVEDATPAEAAKAETEAAAESATDTAAPTEKVDATVGGDKEASDK